MDLQVTLQDTNAQADFNELGAKPQALMLRPQEMGKRLC